MGKCKSIYRLIPLDLWNNIVLNVLDETELKSSNETLENQEDTEKETTNETAETESSEKSANDDFEKSPINKELTGIQFIVYSRY